MRSAAIRIFFFFSIFISFTVKAADSVCQKHQCIAIVDAGSTGSRLHIYAYDVDQTNTPIDIKEVWVKKVKPGFATIEANQEAVDAYLTTLFSGAPEKNLSVYFYATAGMRLLPQPKQKKRYDFLKKWFANQSQWQLRDSRTITGNEEGAFGWLAVNYQLGALNSDDKPAVGVMDMGGASVQIIFPVAKTDEVNSTDVQQFTLYGRHLQLFSHSFLGLGQTEVAHQFLNAKSCFANDYELPSGLAATGNAYSCAKEISPLINHLHRVNRIVQPAIEANPVTHWFVIGGMAELAQSKPFQFDNYQFTNNNLLNQADKQVCHQQWPILNSKYPSNDYIYGYCLFPSYYYALMVDGYGLQPQQAVNFMATNQVSDWTLGAVLHLPAYS